MPAITNFIIHKLLKAQHTREASSENRDAELLVTDSVQRLVDAIDQLYVQKSGKGYGKFSDNIIDYPSQIHIKRHVIDHQIDFVKLSTELMTHLCERIKVELLATGGYVLFAKISKNNQNYLLIAIVTETIGTAINNNLDVVDATHLDMSQLRVAGRIDLTSWQEKPNSRYISFMKTKGDIANYFKNFLGCDEVIEAVEESKKLTSALEEFSNDIGHSSEEKSNFLQAAYNYLTTLGKDIPVSIDALCNHIYPDDPEKLREKLHSDELQLSDKFVPDKRVIKGLVNFEGKSDTWKLSFNRKALIEKHIIFKKENNTLILSNIPKSLLDELIEETNDE